MGRGVGHARRNWTRRSTLVALTIVLALLSASTLAFGSASEPPASAFPPPPPAGPQDNPFLTDPDIAEALEEKAAELAVKDAELDTPEAEADRRETRSAFTDASDSEAIELLDDIAKGLLDPSEDSLSLAQGEQIERYSDDSTAILDVPFSSSDAVVASNLPLVDPDEGGERAEVELDLVQEGDSIEPVNPLVPTTVPSRANGQAKVGDVSVSLAGAGQANAELVNETAVYPDAIPGAQVDYAVNAVPQGLQTLLQLRSAESPEVFELALGLPNGAELRSSEEAGLGGAEVVDTGGELLASVSPAFAWDAEGQPVRVEIKIDGRELRLKVSHHGRDLAYPLLVDPTITPINYYDFTQTGYAGWDSQMGAPGRNLRTQFAFGALFAQAIGTECGAYGCFGYFEHGDYAQWKFESPGQQSAIYRAEIRNLAHQPNLNYSSYVAGIGVPFAGYQDYYDTAEPLSNHYKTYCARPDCLGGGANDNAMYSSVTALFQGPYGNNYRPVQFSDVVFQSSFSGAAVYIQDEVPPVAELVSTGAPSSWTRQANVSTVTQGRDNGVGLKSLRLQIPGIGEKILEHPCTGVVAPNACPTFNQNVSSGTGNLSGQSFSYSTDGMPEGVNRVEATSTDLAGNVAHPASYQVKLDRSAPNVTVTGDGWNPPGGSAVSDGDRRVTVDATDGLQGADLSARRSGVQEVQLRIWDAGVDERPEAPSLMARQEGAGCGSSADSCSLNHSFTFDPGDYVNDGPTATVKLEVTALDEAGNITPDGSTVKTLNYSQDVDEPTVSITTTPMIAGIYLVALQADDPIGTSGGSISSGVRHLELVVDGQTVQEWEQPCPNGGCSMTQARLMTGSQSMTSHSVAAFAEDGAANSGSTTRGATAGNPVQEFGYNDVFYSGEYWSEANGQTSEPSEPEATRLFRGIQVAAEGGAELIRIQINGCEVGAGHEHDPPAQWNWEKFEPFFRQVKAFNATPANDVGVIVHLTDSPVWANDDQELGTCSNDPATEQNETVVVPPENSQKGERFYRQLTAGFLNRFASNPDFAVGAVQAWNEPNTPLYWGYDETGEQFKDRGHADPDHFARLVNIARVEVRDWNDDNNTDVTFLPGALSPAGSLPRVYIRDVLTRDNGKSEDPPGYDNDQRPSFVDPDNLTAWAAHYYSIDEANDEPPRDADGNIIGAKARVAYEDRQVRRGLDLNRDGRPDLDIWITELGFAGKPRDAASDLDQATHAGRLTWAYERFQRRWYDALIVHRVLDPKEGSDNPERGFKLAVIERSVGNQWRPRRAYCDLAAREGLSGGNAPPRCVNPGPLP